MVVPRNCQLLTKSPNLNRISNYFSRTKATYLWEFSKSCKLKMFRRSRCNRNLQSNHKFLKKNRSQAFSRLCRIRVKISLKTQLYLYKPNQYHKSLIFNKPRHKLRANLPFSAKTMSPKFFRIKSCNNKLECSTIIKRATSQQLSHPQALQRILKNIIKISYL